MHPGPVGVEDPGDPDLHSGLLIVGVGQGLRHPLALIVAGPGADWVHVAPVGLGLRVNLGISVNLIGYVYELNIVINKNINKLASLVEAIRILALVLLASPSMLTVPTVLVLMVLTGLYM